MSDRGSSGAVFDINKKKCWIDPKTGYNCFMLFARDLSITEGNNERFWKWAYFQETSKANVEIAELINTYWLEVSGKCDGTNLSTGVQYEVAFMVMLKDSCNGWAAPVKSKFIDPQGTNEEKTHDLNAKPKNQWVELVIGEFQTCQDMVTVLMQFSLFETNVENQKTGLVINGVIFRPKICKPSNLQYDEVIARDLSIRWGYDQRYWRWYCLNDNTSNTTVKEVSELLDVCWLEVKGMSNTSRLSPDIGYEVVFVVMLKNPSDWLQFPVSLRLHLVTELMEHKEPLHNKPTREWFELKVGEFKNSPNNAGEIHFSLSEETNKWKKGLVVKSVIIRPKK